MRFTDRVLSLHPAAVTIVFLALFISGGLAINNDPSSGPASPLFSVVMLVVLAPLLL